MDDLDELDLPSRRVQSTRGRKRKGRTPKRIPQFLDDMDSTEGLYAKKEGERRPTLNLDAFEESFVRVLDETLTTFKQDFIADFADAVTTELAHDKKLALFAESLKSDVLSAVSSVQDIEEDIRRDDVLEVVKEQFAALRMPEGGVNQEDNLKSATVDLGSACRTLSIDMLNLLNEFVTERNDVVFVRNTNNESREVGVAAHRVALMAVDVEAANTTMNSASEWIAGRVSYINSQRQSLRSREMGTVGIGASSITDKDGLRTIIGDLTSRGKRENIAETRRRVDRFASTADRLSNDIGSMTARLRVGLERLSWSGIQMLQPSTPVVSPQRYVREPYTPVRDGTGLLNHVRDRLKLLHQQRDEADEAIKRDYA